MDSPASRPILVLRRSDGLGARLLAFLRAWRFARHVGADLHAHWPSLSYRFRDAEATDWGIADLFDLGPDGLPGVRFLEGALPPPVPGRTAIETDPELRPLLRAGIDAERLFAGRDIVECGAQTVLRVPGETDEAIAQETWRLAERLRPSAPIRAALDAARRALGAAPYVVLHVRRGDVQRLAITVVRTKAAPDRVAAAFRSYIHRCPPVAVLAEAARGDAAGARVLCLGDTPAFIDEARRRVGPDQCLDLGEAGAGLGPLQRALFEILLVRGAAAIHAGSSAFVRVAAETGPARLHLAQPDSDADLWNAAFTAEVLDEAGLAPPDRAPWLAIYRAEWEPIATRSQVLRRLEADRAGALRAAGPAS